MADNNLDIFKKKVDQLQQDNPTPAAADANASDANPPDSNPSSDTGKSASDLKKEANALVKSCKAAYATFAQDAKSDPQGALESLINSLEDLKSGPSEGEDQTLPSSEAPINPPMGM